MAIKNDRQNRLHLGKRPFWNNFETFDREIIIEHKQKPKRYFNIWHDLSGNNAYQVVLCFHVTVLMANLLKKNKKKQLVSPNLKFILSLFGGFILSLQQQ